MLIVQHEKRLQRQWVLLLVFALLTSVTAAEAQNRIIIQPRVVPQRFNEPPASAPAFITNRELSRRLRLAREMFASKDYRTGVRYLQSILDEREDWFLEQSAENRRAVPGPQKTAERESHFSSLKHAAEQLAGSLNAEGRRAYEEEVGIQAGVSLKKAIQEQDESQLNEIARRFFHTEAGYEAVYRLGLLKADHGEPFAAALHFQRLKSVPRAVSMFDPVLSLHLAFAWDRAGLTKQSVAVLKTLKRQSPNGRLRLGTREIDFFDREENASAWLANSIGNSPHRHTGSENSWRVFRGDVSRNTVSEPTSPIGPLAWVRPSLRPADGWGLSREAVSHLDVKTAELAEERTDNKNLLPIPAMQPVIVGNLAVFRTLQDIQAYDLESGRLRWKSSVVDNSLRPALSHASPELVLNPGELPLGGNNARQKSAIESFLVQRLWRDMTTGAISGDHKHIYSIEDAGLADGLHFANSQSTDPLFPKTHNRLLAFSLKDGFAEWEVGGEMIDKDDPIGGTFFLGPPLPVGGQLFCLGERKNEIRLMILDASNGRLIWEQRLVAPALSLMGNPERRMMGLSPAFAHGVMICPTASGAVVAVDISRRMLLWAYQYESTMTEDTLVANMAWQQGRNFQFAHESLHPESRWADSVPVVAEGKVLITPSDSQSLHCLDLSTGALQWERPRGDGIFLAGVFDGQAILVGRSDVRAIRLDNGQDAWKIPVAIPLPAGRGILAGETYHIPLVAGELASIDLTTGRLLAKSNFPGGRNLGNLVAAGGHIVFQSINAIGGLGNLQHIERDIAQRLKKDPQDAEALALRGRFRLHQGEETRALDDLRAAFSQRAREADRVLIVGLLLEKLRAGAKNVDAGMLDELRQLIRTSDERLQFLMLTSSHADTIAKRSAAFRDYLELAKTLRPDDELNRLRPGHFARSDRWVRAKIGELAEAATSDELFAWNQTVEKELMPHLAQKPRETRLRILNSLPMLPAVEAALLEMAGEINGASRLEKTILLKRLTRSQLKKTQDRASLALAETFLELWRTEEAYPYIQKLGKKWPPEWRERFADLKAGQDVTWPDEKLKAAYQQRRVAVLPEIPVEAASIRNSPYSDWTFSVDQQSRKFYARDENGFERWHLDLGETNGPIFGFEGFTISIHGHLAVLSMNTHFAVLDLLKREHTASVIWSQLLLDENADLEEQLRMQQFRRNMVFGGPRPAFQEVFGDVKLVSEDVVVFQTGNRLRAADPLTGNILWIRDHLPQPARLEGTGDYVVVIDATTHKAEVLRATDGTTLREFRLPNTEDQIVIQDGDVVELKVAQDKRQIAAKRLIDGNLVWKLDVEPGSLHQRLGHDKLAILDPPKDRLRVISLRNGAAILETDLDPHLAVKSFHIIQLLDKYVLLTDDGLGWDKAGGVNRQSSEAIRVNGPVYAFDAKTGKQLWKTSLEHQVLEKMPPANSPVLVFLRHRLPDQRIGGFGVNHYLVRILDVRSGEIVSSHNRLKNATPWQMKIQPTRRLITISFYEGVIELEFTKAPLEIKGSN